MIDRGGRVFLLGVLILFNVAVTQAEELSLFGGMLKVHVEVYSPNTEVAPRADFIWFHGLGDSSRNHPDLFKMLNDHGIRVIAFDYPNHGRTHGVLNVLRLSTFSTLRSITKEIVRKYSKNETPLLLGGWSTGGAVALRAVSWLRESKRISALVLFAPGVSVKVFVGTLGIITKRTLTRNPKPPYLDKIKPRSPFSVPPFALSLLFNSWLIRHSQEELPPTLLLSSGDDTDYYVRIKKVDRWAFKEKDRDHDILLIKYRSSYHDILSEPGIGAESLAVAKVWLNAALARDGMEKPISQCWKALAAIREHLNEGIIIN